jgi:hypothetical protein
VECTILKITAVLVVTILIVGCSDESALDSSRAIEVNGVYELGFERSTFSPCGSAERWWIVGSSDAQERYVALGLSPTEKAYVRWLGYRSEPGDYGHMGIGDYEFTVVEVIEMRAAAPGECSVLGDLRLSAENEQGWIRTADISDSRPMEVDGREGA